MRLLLFMGKGGVGKTTIAAATALRCAELGYRTLVASTDVAHSLADALDQPLSAEPVALKTNLWAQEINVLEEVRSYWHLLHDLLATLFQGEGVNPMVAEELAIAPGMDEMACLLRIRQQSVNGNFDAIVVDAAPTGETIRLLTVPESFSWYVERLEQCSASKLSLRRTLDRLVLGKAFDSLNEFKTEVVQLREMLVDPEISSHRIVLNPERMVIKETQRAITYMSLFGYPVDAGIINRVLPPTKRPSDSFWSQMWDLQQQNLKLAREVFTPLPLFEVPWYSKQLAGYTALEKLAADLWNDLDPTQVFWAGPIQRIEESGDEYVLTLPLPNIELGQVSLTKRGDELTISIGNFRRELTLPHALAVREATKARLVGDDSLEIHFMETDA